MAAPAGDSELLSFQCSGCQTLIGYPPAAKLVQCSNCTLISNVEQGVSLVQLPCVQCEAVLSFPSATRMALCPICGAVFQIQTQTRSEDGSGAAAAEGAPAPAAAAAPALRPTTPATRHAAPPRDASPRSQSQSAVTGEQVQRSDADWASVWQGREFSVAERQEQVALEQEFAAATEARDTARLLRSHR
eukprot:TRINITY_DN11242_c0_g1_i1.p1 TRINITY_DN11242_c0_g1~~TRINITY_DN11242_c0_g1_i1.p1  ORF type:complete len:216 (+),score=75.50 TRINITY_DN11242_c0_g1_i1:82-648(+)